MATFQEQVEGLTGLSIGTSPTTGELTQFLTDGAKEIINQMPKHLLPLCSAEQSFTSGSPDLRATTIAAPLGWMPVRLVRPSAYAPH